MTELLHQSVMLLLAVLTGYMVGTHYGSLHQSRWAVPAVPGVLITAVALLLIFFYWQYVSGILLLGLVGVGVWHLITR